MNWYNYRCFLLFWKCPTPKDAIEQPQNQLNHGVMRVFDHAIRYLIITSASATLHDLSTPTNFAISISQL